jgi:hypothetical protein
MSFPPLFPPEDADAFLRLDPAARSRAWFLHDCAKAVHQAGSKRRVATCKELAAAAGKGHWKSIYNPVCDYLRTWEWTALVDRRYHAELWVSTRLNEAALPPEFIPFWHDMVLAQHRCIKTAYRLLMIRLDAWRKGDRDSAIPGFPTPPPNAPGKRHPRKMSYRDLCRNTPSDIETEAIRHGRAAAMKLLPSIRTTRIGGYPGMEFQFDDRWIDVEARYGKTDINRILEFACIEYYSTYHFSPWLRPRVNLDGVNKSLSERDFRLFAVAFAATVGWSPRGSVYRGERGLCAFRSGLDEKLRRHSNDLITIADPGMSGQAAYVGGFAELAKGNPNAKALKEGMGGFLHNLLGGLMGQSGSSPADKPASHVGREIETKTLMALQGFVDRPLAMAHHTFEQVCQAVFKTYEIANTRYDHHCEGWMEEQLVIDEFCADKAADLWIPITSLSAERRAALAILAGSLGDMLRPRPMSPAEVMTPALSEFIRLTPAAIADCIYEDVRRKVTITGAEATFQDLQNYGPGSYRYPATFQRADGFARTLPNGEELWLVVHPALPEIGYFYDFEGRYLGRAARKHDISRHDADRIKREIGKKAAMFNDATLAMQVRHGQKRAAVMTDNARALEDALKKEIQRDMGIHPQSGHGADAPRVPISALFSDQEDHSDFSDPSEPEYEPEYEPTTSRIDPISILLGNP